MKNKKYLLPAFIGSIVILAVTPYTTFGMMDIYRNIESGFIEITQSLRVAGNAVITGNLGIGTTSPGKQVDIYNTMSPELRLNTQNDGALTVSQTPTGASIFTSSTGLGGNLVLGTAGLEKARIDTNGNVGIATSTPTEKLEVNGNIRLSGATPTFRVSNLSDPINNADAANKKYVDARVSANGGGAGSSPYLSNGSYYSEGGDPYFCRLNILSGTTQQIVSVNQNKKCDTANDLYCNGGSCNATVAVVNELKQNGQLVSAAGERSCAVNNGQVYCWGYMGNGQKWKTLRSAGGRSTAFSCGLTEAGKVYCWGFGGYGELGNGSSSNSNVPVMVSGINNAIDVQITSGSFSSQSGQAFFGFGCALLSTGEVKCWGSTAHGLGNGGISSNSPLLVAGISNATSISVAGSNYLGHMCATLSNGQIKCWGSNTAGQLGNGLTDNSSLPVTVLNISSATKVFTSSAVSTTWGYSYGGSCAITSAGAALCWGMLSNGISTTPQNISLPAPVVDISMAGIGIYGHTCFVLSDGRVYCMGYNTDGQLGNGSTSASWTTPVQVSNISNAVKVIAGSTLDYHSIGYIYGRSYGITCALLSSGGVSCWGGSVGSTPVAITNVTDATDFSLKGDGYWHACAISATGGIRCWGYNETGQLGNSTTTYSYTSAVSVSGISNAANISVTVGSMGFIDGYGLSCATLADGQIKCWGAGNQGQLGSGVNSSSNTPVTVSNNAGVYYAGIGSLSVDRSLPEKKDSINAATSVATGPYHTCTIEGGTVYCWGFNAEGQLGNGSTATTTAPSSVVTISTAKQIAVGHMHSCAILQDGTVRCWGANHFGQLGNGTTNSSYIPVTVTGVTGAVRISAGDTHTCVTLTTGGVKCWGSNDKGQLGNGGYSFSSTAVDVSGVSTAAEIASGDEHTCVVNTSNGVQCWGEGRWGQIGNGYNGVSRIAVTVPGVTNARKVGAGSSHTCIAGTDFSLKCWGLNGTWQQASTGYFASSTVQGIPSIQNTLSVAGGSTHSCVVANDSLQAYCFGGNRNGQLGNGGNSPLANASVIAYGVSSVDEDITKYSVALCETKDNFNGNLGGLDGANSICKSQCGMGYKFARDVEMTNFNASVTVAAHHWIDSGARLSSALCNGWTSESGVNSGNAYIFNANTNGIYSTGLQTCNNLLPLICVRGIR